MPDFYYIDLHFNPAGCTFKQVVDACVLGIQASGGEFMRVTMSSPDSREQIQLDRHILFVPDEIGDVGHGFLEEYMEAGENAFSFPPYGRIIFNFNFRVDENLNEEISEEEEEAHSSHRDLGLTFTAALNHDKLFKASLSFWEEYVLTHGDSQVHEANIKSIISILDEISTRCMPDFGAMSPELHLETDNSLALLKNNSFPEGNNYLLVGRSLLKHLDNADLDKRGIKHQTLSSGAVFMDMTGNG